MQWPLKQALLLAVLTGLVSTTHDDGSHSDGGHSDDGHSDDGHSDGGHSDDGHSDGSHSDGGHSNATERPLTPEEILHCETEDLGQSKNKRSVSALPSQLQDAPASHFIGFSAQIAAAILTTPCDTSWGAHQTKLWRVNIIFLWLALSEGISNPEHSIRAPKRRAIGFLEYPPSICICPLSDLRGTCGAAR